MSEYTTLNDLPNAPLKIPPPYWRSSGVTFQIVEALEDLSYSLSKLHTILPEIHSQFDEFFENHPDESEENDQAFGELSEPLNVLESKIKLKCELAIFMSAIECEDKLNQNCVYNLHKDIAESIERLGPPEKLLIISFVLTAKSVKGLKPYESLKKLYSWRNSYAHGHCTDRPTKSLRHNHLISPEYYPTVPKEIEQMLELVEGFLLVSNYLKDISQNEYTRGTPVHEIEVSEYLDKIREYSFIYEGNGEVYNILHSKKGLKS